MLAQCVLCVLFRDIAEVIHRYRQVFADEEYQWLDGLAKQLQRPHDWMDVSRAMAQILSFMLALGPSGHQVYARLPQVVEVLHMVAKDIWEDQQPPAVSTLRHVGSGIVCIQLVRDWYSTHRVRFSHPMAVSVGTLNNQSNSGVQSMITSGKCQITYT
jgi:hypothetical protein